MGLTSMIKAAAQMKNLRRGNNTQGYLKRIKLDSSSEGYSNFMAPLRMKMVEADAEYVRKHPNGQNPDEVFNKRILRPSTDTYLTPEWDEFVPFPTSKLTHTFDIQYSSSASPKFNLNPTNIPPPAWKILFDGFGPSTYGGDKFPLLQEIITGLPDEFPPFYQPQGVSKYGGSFADTTCICNGPGVVCRCKPGGSVHAESVDSTTTSNGYVQVAMPAEHAVVTSAGCGVPGEHMPAAVAGSWG